MIDPASVFDFSGKTVLVVGASRAGIGAAIAHTFRNAGAAVIITGMEDAPAESERDFDYRTLDVTDDAAVAALAGGLERLDVLVNCAAIALRDQEHDMATFTKVLGINLTGSMRMAMAVLPLLRETNGCVVNIGSLYGHFGSPRVPAYGASKGAIHQLTRSLAVGWAEYGVRVNAIAPGFIVTEQSRRGREDSMHNENVLRRSPMGRWGQPDDLAGPALFLASPAAGFVTGVVLFADGGYSAV